MKPALTLCLLLLSPLAAQEAGEKRLSVLEKRVTGVEQRVTRLEKRPRPAAAEPAEPAEPISAVFVKKQQVVGRELGLRLHVELENVSRRRFYAFNGILVFRDAKGVVLWSKPYAFGEPLLPGERIEVALGVSSEKTRDYLRLLKAKAITVALEKQEAYGAD